MAKVLTPKQKKVLTFLVESSHQNSYQPSQDEIADRFEVRKSTVHGHLKAIGEKGYIQLSGGGAKRRIKILRNPDGSPFERQTIFSRTNRIRNEPSRPGLEKIHFRRIELEATGLIYRYIEERCETPDIPIPIPVEGIAEMLGLGIEDAPASMEGDQAGQLFWRERKILVNSSHPRQRQRFTVAHEIGHFVLHSTNETSFCRVRALGREEREADYFAARFLMPTEAVLDTWDGILRHLSRQDQTGRVARMAAIFGVSKEAMLRCLQELRFVNRKEGLWQNDMHAQEKQLDFFSRG